MSKYQIFLYIGIASLVVAAVLALLPTFAEGSYCGSMLFSHGEAAGCSVARARYLPFMAVFAVIAMASSLTASHFKKKEK